MHTPSTTGGEGPPCTEQARTLHLLAEFMTRHQLPAGTMFTGATGRISFTMKSPAGLAAWSFALGKEPGRFPCLDYAPGPFVAYMVGGEVHGIQVDVAYYDHDEGAELLAEQVPA